MVRSYLLTERERAIIKSYLESDVMLEGFYELKHILANLDLGVIDRDRELIDRFLERNRERDAEDSEGGGAG